MNGQSDLQGKSKEVAFLWPGTDLVIFNMQRVRLYVSHFPGVYDKTSISVRKLGWTEKVFPVKMSWNKQVFEAQLWVKGPVRVEANAFNSNWPLLLLWWPWQVNLPWEWVRVLASVFELPSLSSVPLKNAVDPESEIWAIFLLGKL